MKKAPAEPGLFPSEIRSGAEKKVERSFNGRCDETALGLIKIQFDQLGSDPRA